MKRAILFFALVALTLTFPNNYRRWTHAFRPAKCLVNWPHVPEWECGPFDEQKIDSILNQPFSYLAKGAQSYVFESQDQKYVLKLFRFDTSAMPLGQKLERQVRKWLGLRERHFIAKDDAIVKNFTSCKLAYSLVPRQTGLVFIHLNPRPGLPLIHLKDRLGVRHTIDPSRYRFIIQKKGDSFRNTFYQNRDHLEPFVNSYLHLLDDLAAAGLVNLDQTMGRNFAFLNGEAIQIDLGNFVYRPEETETNKIHFQQQLRGWLAKRIPEVDTEIFFKHP